MSQRARQREGTRERIADAAVEAFAELGYRGASTREIAARAGTNQGLITYHFRNKDELWRAAADRVFGRVAERLGARLAALSEAEPRERAREGIRAYVRYAAAHPELFRFLVALGKSDEQRMRWLVERHLKPIYAGISPEGLGVADDRKAHAFYALVGAGSVLFAVAPEARQLTGLDATDATVVERHADFVAHLLLPNGD